MWEFLSAISAEMFTQGGFTRVITGYFVVFTEYSTAMFMIVCKV